MSQKQANSGFLALFLVVIAAGSAAIAHYLWTGRWDAHIRSQLEQRLALYWPELRITIQSARYVAGKGFEVRGLRMVPSNMVPSNPTDVSVRTVDAMPCHITCDELLIYCTNSIGELLVHDCEVRGMHCKRLSVRVVYDANGIRSPQAWYPTAHLARRPFPIHVQQGTVELVDQRSSPARTIAVREVQGLLRPVAATADSPMSWQMEACFGGDLLRRGVASGRAWALNHWTAQVSLTDVALAPELSALLPTSVCQRCWGLDALEASCGLTLLASRQPNDERVNYRAEGQFRQGRYLDSRLIHPLTEIQGEFALDRHRTVIRNLSARHGSALLTGAADLIHAPSPRGSRITGSITGLTLSESLCRLFPPPLTEAYRLFQPGGDVDTTWSLTHDGNRWLPAGEARCRNASFAWRKFPLPVEEIVGSLKYESERLVFDVLGMCANRPVEIRGEIATPGPDWTGWCSYTTRQPIPLDDRFLQALPDRFQRGLATLQPRGNFRIDGRATRRQAGETVEFHSKIEIVDGTLCPLKFPYLFQELRGRVEQHGRHWSFHDITGRNDSARYHASGDWTLHPTSGGILQLELSASNVPFEEELRAALSPSAQRLWQQLRPQGVIDIAEVKYFFDTMSRQKQLQIAFESRPKSDPTSTNSIALQPRAFPYRMDDVTGKVFYHDGRIQLTNLRANHGRTQFVADGEAGMHPDGRWLLRFSDLLADRCRPDRELLTALPERLRRVLEQLHVTGEVCLRGQMTLQGQTDIPHQSRASWDLALDIADATATAGVVLRNVSGEAHVRGESDPQSYQCQGRLMLDSLMANRVHCTNVQGPVWIDQDRIYLGDWNQFQTGNASAQATTLTPVRATVFGGHTLVSAEIIPARNSVFQVHARIDDMKLDQLSRDLALTQGPSRGTASAEFRLEGDARGTATWRGSGQLKVRETDLYRLPVTLALLKQLRTGSSDRAAFDAADLAVRMQGQHLYFDRIDLHGDAVTLKGVGEMSLRRDLNLNFYTMMGREDSYLPAIRPLLGLASQRFLLVRVEGTVDQPVTSREILPGINETLEQLFPELVSRQHATGTTNSIRTVSGP